MLQKRLGSTLMAVALGLVLTMPAAASAQQGPAGAPEAPAAGAQDIDVDRLPVNLSRIERGLRGTTVKEERDGLNLRYLIEVFAQAPPRLIVFTKDDHLVTGPVPWGAPTHSEMLDQMTPQEFSSPRINMNDVFRWLAEKTR